MKDLSDIRAIYLKAGLFLLIGLTAGVLLILENPSWKTAGLLVLAIWAFARLYYFMFYVIQHYIDPSYKFSGIFSFVKYVLKSRDKNAQ